MSVYKEATEAIQTENYERSVVRLLYIFYEAYFYNDVQDDINVILSHALKKASGKPLEDASEILYNAMDKIMEGDLEPDEDGTPQMLCTVAGTEITLHQNQENAPDITATATWENGTLRTGALSGWGEQGEKAIITIFQTEDGGMYATLEISVADMSGTLTLTLIPVE